MKRALVLNNRICEVVSHGKEFEVAPDFKWLDCDDSVTPETHEFNQVGIVEKQSTMLERNAELKAKLYNLDLKTVRGLREFIVSKFGNDPTLPDQVRNYETAAAETRAAIEK